MTKKQKKFQKILMKKNITCKTQNLYILVAVLLITIALLIAVSTYCYQIKYWAKQKHDKLKQILYWQYKLKMSSKTKDIDIKTKHTTFLMLLSI